MSFFRRNREEDDDNIETYKRSRETLTARINPEPAKPSEVNDPISFDADEEEIRQPDAKQPEAQRTPTFSREPMAMAPRRDSYSLDRYRDGATTVARDTSFTGALKTQGNLYIEGTFDGELEAEDTIVIAEGAKVDGQVRARDVLIAGDMKGAIVARERFLAKPTSHVDGDVESAVLIIEEGANINCQFKMSSGGGQ